MDFTFDEDIQFLKKNVRYFIENEVEASAMEIEKQDKIPDRIIQNV